MDIETMKTTFHPNDVYRIALEFFTDRVKASELSEPLTKPLLFDFYDESISEPIDEMKDRCDETRIDFLEAISIMSWALYRVWVGAAIEKGLGVAAINQIDEETVIHLFLENIDCEEGRSILEKVNHATMH